MRRLPLRGGRIRLGQGLSRPSPSIRRPHRRQYSQPARRRHNLARSAPRVQSDDVRARIVGLRVGSGSVLRRLFQWHQKLQSARSSASESRQAPEGSLTMAAPSRGPVQVRLVKPAFGLGHSLESSRCGVSASGNTYRARLKSQATGADSITQTNAWHLFLAAARRARRRSQAAYGTKRKFCMEVNRAREQYVRWLVLTRGLSPHTVRAYNGDVTAFEQYLGTDATLKQIDRDRLIAFFDGERRAGLSARSIRRRISGLRGFCKWLLAGGLLDVDPWAGTKIVAGRSHKLPRIVPAHELDRLLVALRHKAGVGPGRVGGGVLCRPYEATTLLGAALMVTTGVRVHEVVCIECQDIDLGGRSVRLLGKGRRERQVFLTNDWITELVGAYLGTRGALNLRHSRLLFNRHYEPLTASAMRARLRKAAQLADLSARVTPHMLRHTAATQLIEAGVDIRYIQRLLGHASLSTTEIYTHISDNALRRVVSDADVLGRCFSSRDN
jgi:integrase/recombinase XerC